MVKVRTHTNQKRPGRCDDSQTQTVAASDFPSLTVDFVGYATVYCIYPYVWLCIVNDFIHLEVQLCI
jgi:hypothetical protein